MDPRHSFEDHTADVRLHVEAPDLAALLGEAGRALAELMGTTEGPTGAPVPVRVEAPDRGALLVRWIDELVYLSETRGRVWTDIRITRADEHGVEGEVRGVAVEALRTQVKAATFHGLRVEDVPGGLSADVVLDV